MSIFYENFTRLCELKGESITKAAEACGISRNTVHKWREYGHNPNVATRGMVAAHFGVPVDMLSQEGAFADGLPEKPDAPLEWAQADVEADARAARRVQIFERTAGMNLAQLEQLLGMLDVMFPTEGK